MITNNTGYSNTNMEFLSATRTDFVENDDDVRFVYKTKLFETGNTMSLTVYVTVNGHLKAFEKVMQVGDVVESTLYSYMKYCTQGELLEDILANEKRERRNLVQEIMSGGKNIRQYCEKLLDEYLIGEQHG